MKVSVIHPHCSCRSVGECTHHGAELQAQIRALNRLVTGFAKAMREKLVAGLVRKGRTGWDGTDWGHQARQALRHHLVKGDPVDVANFCAFLWNMDQPTSFQQMGEPDGQGIWSLVEMLRQPLPTRANAEEAAMVIEWLYHRVAPPATLGLDGVP